MNSVSPQIPARTHNRHLCGIETRHIRACAFGSDWPIYGLYLVGGVLYVHSVRLQFRNDECMGVSYTIYVQYYDGFALCVCVFVCDTSRPTKNNEIPPVRLVSGQITVGVFVMCKVFTLVRDIVALVYQ